jgi:NitT/TauT family transport system ATP-binding protein
LSFSTSSIWRMQQSAAPTNSPAECANASPSQPFAALDAITRDLLHEELEQVWRRTGRTIVFVTHNVREAARLGGRVLLMSSRPGRIVNEWKIEDNGPRRIESPEVASLAIEITDHLRKEIRRNAA